jgi:hypothetical protein
MAWNAEEVVANLMVFELGRYDDDTHVIGHRSEEARRNGEGRKDTGLSATTMERRGEKSHKSERVWM